MSDNPFEHDDAAFDLSEEPKTIGVSKAESKYAEICSGMLAQGPITSTKRARLDAQAASLGLDVERASRIEQSLLAHQQAHEQAESVASSADEDPFAVAKEPHLEVLQQRIARLESDKRKLQFEAGQQNEEIRQFGEHIERLEELVAKLQFALTSTLSELEETRRDVERAEEQAREAVPEPASSLVQKAGEHKQLFDDNEAKERVDTPNDGASTESATSKDEARRASRRSFTPRRRRARPLLQTLTNEAGPAAWQDAQSQQSLDPSKDHTASSQPHAVDAVQVDEDADLDVDWANEVLSVGPRPRLHSERLRDDPAEIHRCYRERPRDADLLHALFASLQRGDDRDRRWCIAHTLNYLGEANQQELDLYHAYQNDGLVRPTRSVNDDEWFELLFHPDEDRLTSRILAEIAPAMLVGAIPALRDSIAPSLVNPEDEVDLNTTTLQAARCMGWGARILGIDPPMLYTTPSWRGSIDMVLTPKPCTRLGGTMLSGRSNKELAFMAGRHLCWYRPEHVLARPRQVRRALDDMFLVGLMIGNPGLPLKHKIRRRVEPMAAAVAKLLDGGATQRLAHLFREFVAQGGKTNLNDWVVAAERTAACSGLLLANDLHAAESAVRLDRKEVEPVMDELFVFFTAGRATMLRKRIGIAIGGSGGR